MIAKIKVGNPSYSQNMKGEGYLTFSTTCMQNWAVKQVVNELENNKKQLVIKLDYEDKKRSLDQNSLLWALLEEEAKFLNGGRKSNIECSSENLYYEAINKYGKDTLIAVKDGAERELKRVYKRVFIIDKYEFNDELWLKCRCVIGSSKYTSKEMSVLIEGVLDDIARLGIDTQEIRYLKGEYNDLRTNKTKQAKSNEVAKI